MTATVSRDVSQNPADARLDRLELDLGRVLGHLEAMSERQRRMDELLETGIPIARMATAVVGEKLQVMEDQGYVALLRSAKSGMDRVLESFSPEDFELLAQNLVGILEVVRNLTQPEVLALADEAALSMQEAGSARPVSMMAALKASREEEVQRGMAVALHLLRGIGRASASGKSGGRRRGLPAGMDPRLAARLGPSRRAASTEAAAPPPRKAPAAAASETRASSAKAPAAAASETKAPAVAAVAGEGGEWSRELALAIAAAEGVEMTDQAWAIVNHAREVYAKTSSSANIRALTKSMGIETKDIYACFPKAPGRTIARIGGIPKPAGCI